MTQKTSFKAGFDVRNSIGNKIEQVNSNILNQKIPDENLINSKENVSNEKTTEKNWYIEIPSINLKAKISEGTSKETMDKFVGHFEETQKIYGNIGLAAHNRGYENNYFAGLKKLKEGDKIFYRYEDYTKEYEVTKHYIIKDTDWSSLENTKENKITLITCVENQREYRRCIQGEESK